METMKMKRKTQGRRKIEMKKIENQAHLQVTFSKRRSGLFKKASELAILCGVELAIIVQSPAGKIYTFEEPSVEALINRVSPAQMITRHSDKGKTRRSKYEHEEEEGRMRMSGGRWWEEPFDGLGLEELKKYSAALEVLRDDVVKRVGAFESKIPINSAASTSSSAAPLSIEDYGFGDSTTVDQDYAPLSIQDYGFGASTSSYAYGDQDLFSMLNFIN